MSWSPDGTQLAALRYPAVFDDPKHTQVAEIDAASGDVTLLTTALDRNCGPYPTIREPIWDGGHLVFAVEDHGNVHLYRVAADGSGKPELLVGGERTVTGFDVADGRLALTASTPTTLPELFAGERRLTRVGDPFAAGRDLVARGALHGDVERRHRGRGLGHEARRL